MKTTIAFLGLLLASLNTMAQTTAAGRVLGSGNPLSGATVQVKGSAKGTTTNLDGTFSLQVDNANAKLEISYVDYVTLVLTAAPDLGDIELEVSAVGLDEISMIASLAIDRKTPVAKSSIGHKDIIENASNQEFPELLKSMPGIYTTKLGGGYGDSRINIRGFDQTNVAVLVNGIPVNDMENGRIFWSNWAGLREVTNYVQVQRGLGASKVAIPSIGGTINIVTNTIEANPGGTVELVGGNNNYQKTGFRLASGFVGKRWSFTIAGYREKGDGWVEGAQFEGYNYFLNISKQLNDKHGLAFTFFGAPQRHGTRANAKSVQTFDNAPDGIKYNGDWGYQDGQLVQVSDNFYHKPQLALNHYWLIDETTELATVAYASIGRGGGGGPDGNFWAPPAEAGDGGYYRTSGFYGPIDLDRLVTLNETSTDGSAVAFLRASHNDHFWTGILSTMNKKLASGLNLQAGLDARYYIGGHYRTVTNLLGASYVLDNSDVNQPNKQVRTGEKYAWHNDDFVSWIGGFAQADYQLGKLDLTGTFSVASTSYQRLDYFLFLEDDPNRKTEAINFFSYTAKIGANYNITKNHNFYFNTGYFTRPPTFDNAIDYTNQVNAEAIVEKVFSGELGYGFRSRVFTANLNLYRTQWQDRTLVLNYLDANSNVQFANLSGVNALHSGVEIEAKYHPVPAFTVFGMISLGDWIWQNDLTDVEIYDEDRNLIGTANLYIADLKVGDAAQTTAAAGLEYAPFHGMKLGANLNYFTNYYAQFDPQSRTDIDDRGVQSWKTPSFTTVDIRLIQHFPIGDFKGTFLANVNNLFDEAYIADAYDGAGHDQASANVFYGFGRTWTIGLEVAF